MPRRCRFLSVIGLAGPGRVSGLVFPATLAAVLLGPISGRAQTPAPDPGADLLQPSLSGTPNNPPGFVPNSATAPQDQAPPAGRFTVPARSSAAPIYGSPTGFGAGDTGFDSSNRGKSKRLAQAPDQGSAIAPTFDQVAAPPPQVSSRPPVLAPPLPPEIHPAKAASRPGATLPPPPDQPPLSNPPAEVYPLSAAIRRGAVLPIPPAQDFAGSASTPPPGTPPPNTLPLGAVPQSTLPIAGADPYEALGIKAGSFLILPAVELSAGYDTNPQHSPTAVASPYFVVAPELHVRSDWSSSSLTADIVGSYFDYTNNSFQPSLSRPYLNAKVDGRLDVTRATQILLESRLIVATDNPGSPNIQAGLAKLPYDTTVGGTLGVDQQFNRLDVSLKGTIDRSFYQDSLLTDGETVSNDYRAFNQYAGIMRVGYEIDPGFKPFVEVSEYTRVHDQEFDIYGENRNSNGASAKIGGAFNVFGSLTGEVAIGYLMRDYHDPTLPNISGATLDGSLLWQMSGLTTAKLTAASAVNESDVQGVSGSFSRDVSIEVDHALRRWLIANGQIGYGRDEYVGLARDDNRYFVAGGLTYKLNREMQIKGQIRHDWLTSTQIGNAYQATSFLLTLRLQR